MTDSGHGVADLAGQIRGMRSRIYQDRHGPDLSGGGRTPSGVMWVFGLVTRSGAAVACLWRVQVPCSDVAWLRLH